MLLLHYNAVKSYMTFTLNIESIYFFYCLRKKLLHREILQIVFFIILGYISQIRSTLKIYHVWIVLTAFFFL